MHNSPATQHPDLIVGIEYADDAGVFMAPGGDALVQTVDFFTPIVDDPFDWGRIAAANALSDVYAMGGDPLTALQLVGWPRGVIGFDVLERVIEGGLSVMEEAGCTVVGGHSIDDPEPKYGFAVTGIVEPGRLQTNAGARPADQLVLTKPLGTGIITTALKAGKVDEELARYCIETMAELNAGASLAMAAVNAHACTDVTGYGLLGHLRELLTSAGVSALIEVDQVPLMDGVEELLEAGFFPGGSQRNLEEVSPHVTSDVEPAWLQLFADAQTSGGLLICVPPAEAQDLLDRLEEHECFESAVIGEIHSGAEGTIRLVR